MKKVLAIVVAFVFIALIVIAALAYQRMNSEGDDIYFEGTIIELNGTNAIVEPFEGESIRGSADKISVNLFGSDENFAVGNNIRIYYSGEVMESYPAQVVAEGVEKID